MYNEIINHRKNLLNSIQSLRQQLKRYPDGTLFCTRNGKYIKWFNYKNHSLNYIKKSEKPTAENLAAKKYLTELLVEATNELQAIDLYLCNYNPQSSKAALLLDSDSPYMPLLFPYFTPASQTVNNWVNATYPSNPNHPEHLIHSTLSGGVVRSKSESMIDMFLFINKIPFRYECILSFDNDVVFYPDFTIMHPETGKIFYWEHFGKMDDPNYNKNVFNKLKIYTNNGIIPGVNLITTYETAANPLSSDMLEKIIGVYFK